MEHYIDIKNEKRFSDKIVLLLFCSYFILKPFYFWSSGLPQISDFVLLLMIVVHLIKDRFIISFSKQSKMFIFTSLGFVLYILLINIVWSLILNGNLEFFKTSLFYIYNFLASLIVLALYKKYQDVFYKYINTSVLMSIFIQLAIYLINGGFDGTRALAFFNNPNQLGYHNLLMLAFLLMISQKEKLKTLWLIIGVFAALILCFSSLSKAAIIAYSGMLVYFLFMKIVTKAINKRTVAYFIIIIFILLTTYYFYREIVASNQLYRAVIYRIARVGSDKDDNFSGRGYDRLAKYPQYLVFGSGEGESSRFGYYIELHSTLGNILMSYGVIGLLLYLASIVFAIKNNRYKDAYIVFFIVLYGLTHNGIRNTLLWILVALISTGDANKDAIKHISLRKEGEVYRRIY